MPATPRRSGRNSHKAQTPPPSRTSQKGPGTPVKKSEARDRGASAAQREKAREEALRREAEKKAATAAARVERAEDKQIKATQTLNALLATDVSTSKIRTAAENVAAAGQATEIAKQDVDDAMKELNKVKRKKTGGKKSNQRLNRKSGRDFYQLLQNGKIQPKVIKKPKSTKNMNAPQFYQWRWPANNDFDQLLRSGNNQKQTRKRTKQRQKELENWNGERTTSGRRRHQPIRNSTRPRTPCNSYVSQNACVDNGCVMVGDRPGCLTGHCKQRSGKRNLVSGGPVIPIEDFPAWMVENIGKVDRIIEDRKKNKEAMLYMQLDTTNSVRILRAMAARGTHGSTKWVIMWGKKILSEYSDTHMKAWESFQDRLKQRWDQL